MLDEVSFYLIRRQAYFYADPHINRNTKYYSIESSLKSEIRFTNINIYAAHSHPRLKKMNTSKKRRRITSVLY